MIVTADGQGPHRAHPVHRDRPGHGRPSRWLHPDHQDRSPQGRRRPDGRHRAGQGRGRREQAASPHPSSGRRRGRPGRAVAETAVEERPPPTRRPRPTWSGAHGAENLDESEDAAVQKGSRRGEAAADAETAADLAGAHGAENLDESRTTPRRALVTPLASASDENGQLTPRGLPVLAVPARHCGPTGMRCRATVGGDCERRPACARGCLTRWPTRTRRVRAARAAARPGAGSGPRRGTGRAARRLGTCSGPWPLPLAPWRARTTRRVPSPARRAARRRVARDHVCGRTRPLPRSRRHCPGRRASQSSRRSARTVVAPSRLRQNAAKSCSPRSSAAASFMAARSRGRGFHRVSRRRSGSALVGLSQIR